ncbi:SDR family NAD(P)-dependent oxidoreductase [Lysinibacillus sp. OTC-L20]|uniref:SDR family NAD(P)-dependent oxidoreductase n=1 Tax=Lysinibacillus sp. OTC-L20 TaxID=3342791 RepID=UPI0035B6B6C7
MLLKEKKIIVTGCYKGIGKATLERLAEEGAFIWAFTENVDAEFEEFVSQLKCKYGVQIEILKVNLFEEQEIKLAYKKIINSKQPLDGLVNIAGITYNALLSMTSIKEMKKLFELNFFSQILMTQYAVKIMSKFNTKGSIVNISSVSAIDGNRGQVAYSSSKAALLGATMTLAEELGEHGIRVNAVAPGVIDSSMTSELKQEDYVKLVDKTQFKRAGSTKEVADVLVYLLSDLSSYVTGQIIRIDGGMR